ncbi:MAG TPA: TonB-dependent receptor plug domain-containing protein, partial [Nitrospira sp.]|nr:TonB-dependent receptor plug domain-containing protein [Nitrospira sp.]
MAGRIRVMGGRAVWVLAIGLGCSWNTLVQAQGIETTVPGQEASDAGTSVEERNTAVEPEQPAKSKPVKIPEVMVKDVHERSEPDQESVKDIAGSVNVVTREEIQRARPKNADEMLRRVPGVNVLDEYGQGLRPNIGIRGMDPRRSKNILLMMDDIPIQPALFGDASTYYMVPIERIDHIEVIKGGASVLYSPNTQGGLINFIRKGIPTTPTFSTTNTFGSFNLFQSDTQYGGYWGNFGAQLGYVRRQSDGFRDRSKSQLDDFTMRFEANPDDRTRITTNISWYDETTQ